MIEVSKYPYQRVWVAGHRGMVGSAIVRRLHEENVDVITVPREDLNLLDQQAVQTWIQKQRLDAIIIAAAKVGGILANHTMPASFLSENLVIQSNIVDGAHFADVNRVIFLGSSCIYPKFSQQPILESYLLTGELEPTNQWYAVAKIAGIKLCQAYKKQFGRDFISIMPCNVYGKNDNFDPLTSHVIPGMMQKFHSAKIEGTGHVTLWGSGRATREFIYVDDLADGIVFLTQMYHDLEHINCGTGQEITIFDLASKIAAVVQYGGQLHFGQNGLDGTPRKLMDNTKLHELGWSAKTSLQDGLSSTYEFYKSIEKSNSPSRSLPI